MPALLATVRKYYTCVTRTFFSYLWMPPQTMYCQGFDQLSNRPIRQTQCYTQFKSPKVKILCVLYLHYSVAFTFKWYANGLNNWVQHWVSRIGLFLKALYFSGFLCLYITILWPEADRNQKNRKTIIIGKGKCRMQSVQPETSHFAPITWPPIFKSFSTLQI